MKTEFELKKLEMFETFLDEYIDAFGIEPAIQYLYDNGFTREDLVALKFEEDDIEDALVDYWR